MYANFSNQLRYGKHFCPVEHTAFVVIALFLQNRSVADILSATELFSVKWKKVGAVLVLRIF